MYILPVYWHVKYIFWVYGEYKSSLNWVQIPIYYVGIVKSMSRQQ